MSTKPAAAQPDELSWQQSAELTRCPISGEVLEIERPRRLVLSWRNEFVPDLKAEGYSRVTFELEAEGGTVKLTVTHEMERENSKLIAPVSNGWPGILSSLKCLIETGHTLPGTDRWPEGV